MSRIDERLEVMGVDTTGMTDEEKFTAATGLTRYDADMAANDWYVPAGAANTPSTASEPSGESGEPSGESGESSQTSEPSGQTDTQSGEPSGESGESGEPSGPAEESGESGEGDTNPSTAAIETSEPVVETYTAEEAAAYNLTLDGALQYGAIKTPAVEAVEAQEAVLYEDAEEYNAAKGTELTDGEFEALDEENKIKTPAVEAVEAQEAVLYTNEEVDSYNATLEGAVSAGDPKE